MININLTVIPGLFPPILLLALMLLISLNLFNFVVVKWQYQKLWKSILSIRSNNKTQTSYTFAPFCKSNIILCNAPIIFFLLLNSKENSKIKLFFLSSPSFFYFFYFNSFYFFPSFLFFFLFKKSIVFLTFYRKSQNPQF